MSTVTLPPIRAQRRAPFPSAVARYWLHATRLRGRSSRSEYWWAILHIAIINVALGLVSVAGNLASFANDLVSIVLSFALIVPSTSLLVRRLHDRNRSGWWALLQLVPIVGSIILLVWALQRGTDGPNRFDEAAPASRGRSTPRAVGITIGALIAGELLMLVALMVSVFDVWSGATLTADLGQAGDSTLSVSPLGVWTAAATTTGGEVVGTTFSINPFTWHVCVVAIAALLLIWQRLIDRHENRHSLS